MFRQLKCIAAVVAASALWAVPAAAEEIDVSTITCGEFVNVLKASDKADQGKLKKSAAAKADAMATQMGVILIWLHGYNAPEDRGTVMDPAHVSSYAEKLIAFCMKNAKIGLKTASEKFSGENSPKLSKAAFDVSTMKCSVIKDGTDDTTGMAIAWLAGWHAGIADDSTFDIDALGQKAGQFGDYCAKNPSKGFATAAKAVFGEAK